MNKKSAVKPQHTPTPWEVNPVNENSIRCALSKRLVGNQLGAFDAAFIVRAVNSHEALVKAMKEAMELLRNGSGEERMMSDAEVSAIETLEEALAKAEGE